MVAAVGSLVGTIDPARVDYAICSASFTNRLVATALQMSLCYLSHELPHIAITNEGRTDSMLRWYSQHQW